MSIASIREQIGLAEFRMHNCYRKADAAHAEGNKDLAATWDMWGAAAAKEADELYRELREAEDDSGARFIREYVRDMAYGRSR